MKLLRYLWRNLRWFLRCLWEGKKVPRILEGAPYSRSYMRKYWAPILRLIDFEYNRTRDEVMLWNRRVNVAKRRACKFE